MEKGKKNVKSSKDGVKSPAKVEKAKTKAKNVIKPRDANTSIGEMVTATLQALNNDGGVSFMQIRNFILKNYGGFGKKMGKTRQAEMRQFMKEEFEKGKIVMTNYDGSSINFIMRFKLVAE